MLGFSLPEILFLAALGLVVIGPKQLPEVARTVGRFLNDLRRTSNSFTEEFKTQMKIDPIRFDSQHPPAAQDAIAEPEIVFPIGQDLPGYNREVPATDTHSNAAPDAHSEISLKPKDPGSENT